MDNPSFNLVTEPWIRVATSDAATKEMSLREIFRNAARIDRIMADDPMQYAALLRLLIAITYGAYPDMRTPDQWKAMRDELASPDGSPAVDEYLDRWKRRFDLFDPARPFMQVADLTPSGKEYTLQLNNLVMTMPVNKRAFNTCRPATSLSPAEAARNLIETHAYGVAGVHLQVAGQEHLYYKNRGCTGWCGGFRCLIIEGETLADTIAFNHAYEIHTNKWESSKNKPVWELDPQTSSYDPRYTATRDGKFDSEKKGNHSSQSELGGPAALMTRQRFRIRLITDPTGTRVVNAMVANGDVAGTIGAWPMETMGQWRINQKDENDATPAPFKDTSRLWRGFTELVTIPDKRDAKGALLPPATIECLNELQKDGILNANEKTTLRAISVAYGNNAAVVDRVVEDQMDARLSMLTAAGAPLRENLSRSVQLANDYVGVYGTLYKDLTSCVQSAKDKGIAARTDRAKAGQWHKLDNPFRALIAALDPERYERSASLIDQWNADMLRMFIRSGQQLAENFGSAAFRGRVDDKGRLLDAGTMLNKYVATLHKTTKKGLTR